MKQNRVILLIGLGILLLPALAIFTYPGVYVGDGADAFSYQMPMRDLVAQAWRSGEMLSWNPYILGGVPAHAGMQLGLLYPPNILLSLLFGHSVLVLTYVLHLLLLGAGAMVLARVHLGEKAKDSPWPLLGSAAVWLGSGATWGHLYAGHVSFVEAWALWPWTWALTLHAWKSRQLLWILLAGAVLALQILAGHPQATWLCGMGLGALLLAHVVADPEPVLKTTPLAKLPKTLAALVILALLTVIAVLLAAGQLLPTALMSPHLNRSLSPQMEMALSFSAHPRSLLTVLAPDVWGTPGHALTEISYHETLAWVGAMGLALGLLGVVRSGLRGWILLAMIGFFVLLSPGKDSPLLPSLVETIPGFGAFRVPGRWLVPAAALLAVLVADALTPEALPKTPKQQQLSRFPALLLAIPALLTLYLWLGLRPDRGWWGDIVATKLPQTPDLQSKVSAELLAVTLTLGVGTWLALDRRWLQKLLPILAGIAVLEAAWFGFQHVGVPFQRPEPLVAWSAEDVAVLHATVKPENRLASAAMLRQANWGGRAELRMAGGYEPSVTREHNWYANLLMGHGVDGYSINFQVRAPTPWLDRMAATHLLVDPRDSQVLHHFDHWPLTVTLPGGRQLRQNPAPLPRLGWAENVEVQTDPKQAIEKLAQLDKNTTLLGQQLQHTRGAGGSIQVQVDAHAQVVAQVQASAPAVLVLRDADAPGWQVSVDDHEQPSVRADGLFRAVSVPAGTHTVKWQFVTPGLQAGLGISALATLLVAGLALWLRRRQGL